MPKHPADAAKMCDEVQDAALLLTHRDQGRILRRLDAKRMIGCDRRLEQVRQLGKGDRNFVQAARQQFERIDVAARRLTAGAHDEDVIAELFRFAENLRRQHDGAAARRLLS